MWKDFKWVEKRFGKKFANILKGFDKGSKEIEEHFTTKENHEVTFIDANGVQNTLVTEQGIPEILTKNGLIEVKWQELKDKRDNGELIPGSLYRITDYQCTTTQENTQSAGHQFDIVLLALSDDKLAEEGWAMMHDNIYDVTFADGVTKKCYIYYTWIEGEEYNIVDIATFNGIDNEPAESVVINEEEKTAVVDEDSSTLIGHNIIYNYFQNSNLSAWKVWYCLDNDTARFAWADDSVDEGSSAYITVEDNDSPYTRDLERDIDNLYAWTNNIADDTVFTTSETPQAGDTLYIGVGETSKETLESFTPAQEGTGLPNGRGVIYRLIDEWNNDVPYDFKNIMYYEPITNGYYDFEGNPTYVYTFNYCDLDNNSIYDGSMINGKDNIVGESQFCQDNKISPLINYNGHDLNFIEIFNVFSILDETIENSYSNNLRGKRNRFKGSTTNIDIVGNTSNLLVEDGYDITFINCETGDFEQYGSYNAYSVYIMGKKVLTEE